MVGGGGDLCFDMEHLSSISVWNKKKKIWFSAFSVSLVDNWMFPFAGDITQVLLPFRVYFFIDYLNCSYDLNKKNWPLWKQKKKKKKDATGLSKVKKKKNTQKE